jgi:hypothetical protein
MNQEPNTIPAANAPTIDPDSPFAVEAPEPSRLPAPVPILDALAAETAARAEAANPLAAVPLDQFLAVEDPAPDWIVDGLLERGDKGNLVAPSKTFKTWFALALAMHVALGRNFLGRFRATQKRRVLYVNLEVKPSWTRRRFRALCAFYRIAPELLAETLHVVCARGRGAPVRKAIDAGAEAFKKVLALRWQPDLIILDPRYKLMLDGEDENSSKEIKGFLDAVDKLASYGPAVLVVSHDGKGDISSKSLQSRGAGSYAAAADDDARIGLARTLEPDAIVVETLSRNGAGASPFVARWKDTGDGALGFVRDDDAEAVKVAEDRPRGNGGRPSIPLDAFKRSAYKLLSNAATSGLPAGVLEVKLMDETRAGRRTAQDRISELCAQGEIVKRQVKTPTGRGVNYFLPAYAPSIEGGAA